MTDLPQSPQDGIASCLCDLRAVAMSPSRNQAAAADLMQDTIVKAWSNVDKFTLGTNLRAWLFTILRNSFYASRRKASCEVGDPDSIQGGNMSVLPQHHGRLAFREFLVAFNQLSPEHREALIVVGANGYSYDEAAAEMGIATGTAKSRANRARARLCEFTGVTAPTGNPTLADFAALAVVLQSGLAVA